MPTTRRLLAPALFLALALIASRAHAVDIHVDAQSGSDSSDGLSWLTAKKTVIAGLTQAALSPGPDSVLVARGRYVGSLQVPSETTLLGGFPVGGGARDWRKHPTILDARGGGTVVTLGPGTDASVVDGFFIEGGAATSPDDGGGLTLRGTAARIASCTIERNVAPAGGGVLVDARGLTTMPLVDRCVIRANRATTGAGSGAGVLVLTDDDAPTAEPLVHGSLIDRNVVSGLEANPGAAGGVYVRGQAHLGHVHVRGNAPNGVVFDGVPRMTGSLIMNAEISGSPSDGLVVGCGSAYVMVDNCTLVANGGAAIIGRPLRASGDGAWQPHVEHGILWGDGVRGLASAAGCTLFDPMVHDSIVEGGLAFGDNVLDVDPQLVKGPAMSYYLASIATGHPSNSVALDAGPDLASDLGLERFTTQTNSDLDVGPVDWGAHCEPMDMLTIARGTSPWALPFHASTEMVPYWDTGALHDPANPLLFYDIPSAWSDLHVAKDESTGAVVLVF